MTCATTSNTSVTGLLRAPIAAMAVPKNNAKMTICRISLRAIESMTLVGMVWEMKPLNDSESAFTVDSTLVAGTSNCIALPGSNNCTRINPNVSDTSDAPMNQPIALLPTRPTVAISPILAMPTTSVENTSGAMIILIRRRNIVGSSAATSANLPLDSGKYSPAL